MLSEVAMSLSEQWLIFEVLVLPEFLTSERQESCHILDTELWPYSVRFLSGVTWIGKQDKRFRLILTYDAPRDRMW